MANTLRILGVDPGLSNTGYAILDVHLEKWIAVEGGVIRTKSSDSLEIRLSIIYKAIEDVKLALEGLLEPEKIEEIIGVAEVRDQFKIPKMGIIAGCYITKGKVVRNAMLRVRRDDKIIHEGKLTSL